MDITIYTFTTYPGLQPLRHNRRPVWRPLLHVTPTPRKRPANQVRPTADSPALHAAHRRAAAQHQNNLLPRNTTGPGTVNKATHRSTNNLLARHLPPEMALEDTLWVYHGKSRTARLAVFRTIIPEHVQGTVVPFTIYAVPHPTTAQCTHCNNRARPPCSSPCPPLPGDGAYTWALYLGTRSPTSCPRRTATTPYHSISSNTSW